MLAGPASTDHGLTLQARSTTSLRDAIKSEGVPDAERLRELFFELALYWSTSRLCTRGCFGRFVRVACAAVDRWQACPPA